MTKAAYSFTIPSIHDDTPLECRIYEPTSLAQTVSQDTGAVHQIKGAILAHPYAPLGGCYDDKVVLTLVDTLLEQDYVVTTFNFRGAGSSSGRTSWSGRAETDDYVSVVGMMLYYLHHLSAVVGNSTPTIPGTDFSTDQSDSDTKEGRGRRFQLLLGGYSYGALILAGLPTMPAMLKLFQDATVGTAAAEIFLRGRILAKQTAQAIIEYQTQCRQRGRPLKPEDAGRRSMHNGQSSPVTIGGEETDASDRRRSRDSRRSGDLIRQSVDLPRRIKASIRRRSDKSIPAPAETEKTTAALTSDSDGSLPNPIVSCLVISPVLLPFTNTLAPPGPPTHGFRARKHAGEGSEGSFFLQYPTLAVFGTRDAFTAGRRLRAWAEKQQSGTFTWHQVEDAGHFWLEEGVMQVLQDQIAGWTAEKAP